MSYPLDFNLRRVAKLRQVSIKTARDWRDSENRKWFLALEDLARFRKERGRDIIDTERRSFFDELNLAELEVEQSRREILEAEVIEALPNALFKLRLESGQEIIGHLSGKMRIHYIRVVPGDRVKVQMTPYDLSKGRIITRLK